MKASSKRKYSPRKDLNRTPSPKAKHYKATHAGGTPTKEGKQGSPMKLEEASPNETGSSTPKTSIQKVAKRLDYSVKEPSLSKPQPCNDKLLDHIASLIEPSQATCSAASMLGNKLVIASNTIHGGAKSNKELKATAKTLELLGEFARDQKADKWTERMMEHLVRAKIASDQDYFVLASDEEYIKSVIKVLQGCVSGMSVRQIKKQLQSAHEGLDDKRLAFIISMEVKTLKWLRKIVKDIKSAPDLEAAKALAAGPMKTTSTTSYPLIHVKKDGKLDQGDLDTLKSTESAGYGIIAMGQNKKTIHAEIKIAWLNIIYSLFTGTENKYIGISKKSCHHCNSAMTALNQALLEAGYQFGFNWRGTHNVSKEKSANIPFNKRGMIGKLPKNIKKILVRASKIYEEFQVSEPSKPIAPAVQNSEQVVEDGEGAANTVVRESMYYSSETDDSQDGQEENIARTVYSTFTAHQSSIAALSQQNAGTPKTQHKFIKHTISQRCMYPSSTAMPVIYGGVFGQSANDTHSSTGVLQQDIAKSQQRIALAPNSIILGLYSSGHSQWIPFAVSLMEGKYRLYYKATDGMPDFGLERLIGVITKGTAEICLHHTSTHTHELFTGNSMTVALANLDILQDFASANISVEQSVVQKNFAHSNFFGHNLSVGELKEAITKQKAQQRVQYMTHSNGTPQEQHEAKTTVSRELTGQCTAICSKLQELLNVNNSSTSASAAGMEQAVQVVWQEDSQLAQVAISNAHLLRMGGRVFDLLSRLFSKQVSTGQYEDMLGITLNLDDMTPMAAVQTSGLSGADISIMRELQDMALSLHFSTRTTTTVMGSPSWM